MASLKMRQVEVLRWGKQMACIGSTSSSSSEASYMRIMNKKAASLESCQGGSFFFKRLISKIRYKWKQYYLKRQLNATPVLFSYDAHSYAQNFDSGRPFDRRSPFAP